LDEVERGDIPKGSVLIIENLDRLSRENPWDSVPLLCSLVNAGITVATLSPTEMLYERGSNMTPLILAVVEFGRSHSESASKSNRMDEVWSEKRRQVREEGAVLTRRLPAWIKEEGGKLALVADRAKIVRRIFGLAIGGCGLQLIIKQLTKDEVATWGGRNTGWSKTYVRKLLTSRTTLGEYQPISHGKPDGEPIPDYFPAVIDESTWFRVQESLRRRKQKGVRIGGKFVTLFQGLLFDAITTDKLVVSQQGRTARRILRSAKSMEGQVPCVSFPAEIFEMAVLSMLKEIDPATVLGEAGPAKSELVAAKLAVKEQQVRQIDALMDEEGADSPTLGRRVLKLDKECAELKKELAILRQQEANPLSVAWAESRSLWEIAVTEQGHRLRLRELLRTIIDEVWVLIVPRKSHRLAAVQIRFQGDGTRDYLIYYRSAARGREGSWNARSLKHACPVKTLDLRDQVHVCALKKMLESIDLNLLSKAME
jgi:DNA invertase Pin-like site-specific DNA recombinase